MTHWASRHYVTQEYSCRRVHLLLVASCKGRQVVTCALKTYIGREKTQVAVAITRCTATHFRLEYLTLCTTFCFVNLGEYYPYEHKNAAPYIANYMLYSKQSIVTNLML